jgi:hypothetical protein
MQSTATSLKTPPFGQPEAESTEDSARLTFDRAFEQSGVSRANILTAFEAILRDLPARADREERLREVAKAAALSTARSHGNIIETGRILLGNIDELGSSLSLDVRKCKDQVMLGLAEGACQIGPIVYGRFLDIASEYRDNADDWIAKNKRRAVVFEAASLPVIVPFEAELTLATKPFREGPAMTPPASQPCSQIEDATADSSSSSSSSSNSNSSNSSNSSSPQEDSAEPDVQWSRPKGKGFFRRLSDVMGSIFSRR